MKIGPFTFFETDAKCNICGKPAYTWLSVNSSPINPLRNFWEGRYGVFSLCKDCEKELTKILEGKRGKLK